MNSSPKSDIPPLPDAAIEAIRQAVSDSDASAWQMGDLLAGLVDELGPHYSAFMRHPRAWMIRQIASRTGADASTLRDRECMARFFSPDDRIEFYALSYHQMRACKSAGENWRKWAEWAANNLPAPVDYIRKMIKHNGEAPPAWWGKWVKVQELCEQLEQDTGAPVDVRNLCHLLNRGAEIKGVSGDPAER